MSDLPNLDAARAALAATEAVPVPFTLWQQHCGVGHIVASWDHEPTAEECPTECMECSTFGQYGMEEPVCRSGCRPVPAQVDAAHLRDALAVVDALAARLAEAEATLANERGEGEPPGEGWASRLRGDAVRWVRNDSRRPGRVCDVVHGRNPDGTIGWHWWDRTISVDGEAFAFAEHGDGYARTAREGMRAADAVRTALEAAPKVTP